MANVAHSTLTGADLHEPKGASTAASGQVYVANGSGSGAWTTISGLTITGMVADFATPVAPSGWLECDGSAVSRTTFAALFSANTIQQSGTRSAGTAIISGLSSTANMRAGYFVGGTGITNGTTILSVDSGTQITMSANAGSSGTSTVIVSPWALGDGTTTFTLPNTSTSGRYRRSRTAALHMGVSHADTTRSHTHTGTSATSGAHTHTGTTDNGGVDHTHIMGIGGPTVVQSAGSGPQAMVSSPGNGPTIGASAYLHTHAFTSASNGDHTHTFTTDATGGAETAPVTMVVITCIKT